MSDMPRLESLNIPCRCGTHIRIEPGTTMVYLYTESWLDTLEITCPTCCRVFYLFATNGITRHYIEHGCLYYLDMNTRPARRRFFHGTGMKLLQYRSLSNADSAHVEKLGLALETICSAQQFLDLTA